MMFLQMKTGLLYVENAVGLGKLRSKHLNTMNRKGFDCV